MEMGCDCDTVPLFGERRDKKSSIRSHPVPGVGGFSRLRFPFISRRRLWVPRGKKGSAHPGTGPWCPRGSPRRGRQQKGRREQHPPFPGGIPAARSLSKRNAAGARWNRSPRAGEGSAQHPCPRLGDLRGCPRTLCSLRPLSGCVPHSGSAGEKEMSPLRLIPSPPAAPSSSTWLAQVFHVNDSNKYLIMSRSYRRLAEQPALMRHPGEAGEKRGGRKKIKRKVFLLSPKWFLEARPGRGDGGMRGAEPLVSPERSQLWGRAQVQTRPL